MDQLQQLKFDGFIPIGPMHDFMKIFTNQNLIVEPQSGLALFFNGYQYEIQGDFKSAMKLYQQGASSYLDPFCSYRLSEIYSRQNNFYPIEGNKILSFKYLCNASLMELYYSENQIAVSSRLKILVKESNESILESLEIGIIKQYCKFLSGIITYNDLINYIEENKQTDQIQILFLLMISHMETSDKQIDRILEFINTRENLVYFNDFLKQLKQNIQILVNCEKDSCLFERQREILFEMAFLIKDIMEFKINPLKFDQVPDFENISETIAMIWSNMITSFQLLLLFVDKVSKSIHQSMILRLNAMVRSKGNPYENINPNVFQALEIQKQELALQKSSQNYYALAYYKIGKLENKMQSSAKQTYYKAREMFKNRLNQSTIDDFQNIICNYYLSRLSNLSGNYEDEFKYLVDTKKQYSFQQMINSCLEKNLNRVRTLQFHAMQKKVIRRYNQIETQKKEQQTLIEEEKAEQLRLIQEQRQMMQALQFSQSEDATRISPFKISSNDVLTGPMSVSMLVINQMSSSSGESVITQYMSKIKEQSREIEMQSSFERIRLNFREQDGLYFVERSQLENCQFIQKGSFGGAMYRVIIAKKKYAMKTVLSIKREHLSQIINNLKELSVLKHPNLRKCVGLMIDEIDEQTIDLNLIYEYCSNNLYGFESVKHISFKERLQVAIDIVGAISHLHSNFYFHGNIKPTNVLTTLLGGQIFGYIADWEFVQHIFPIILAGNQGICKTYSAPEVIKDPKSLSIESDIWSMGLLLLFIFFEVDVLREKNAIYLQMVQQQKQLRLQDFGVQSNKDKEKIMQLINEMLRHHPFSRRKLETVVKELVLLQSI